MEFWPQQIGKLLIAIGATIVLIGALFLLLGQLGFFKLPDDLNFSSKKLAGIIPHNKLFNYLDFAYADFPADKLFTPINERQAKHI